MSKNEQITYLGELQRKSIHITSMLIPTIYYFIDTKTALLLLAPVTILTLLIDLGIYYSESFRNIAYPIVGGMLRPHEMHHDFHFSQTTCDYRLYDCDSVGYSRRTHRQEIWKNTFFGQIIAGKYCFFCGFFDCLRLLDLGF
jgi:hypothetical protein